MPLNDFSAHGEPDAGTRIFLLAVQALEDDEDALEKLWRDANAVVAYRKHPIVLLALDPNMDR
jgi:hypothetical protein